MLSQVERSEHTVGSLTKLRRSVASELFDYLLTTGSESRAHTMARLLRQPSTDSTSGLNRDLDIISSMLQIKTLDQAFAWAGNYVFDGLKGPYRVYTGIEPALKIYQLKIAAAKSCTLQTNERICRQAVESLLVLGEDALSVVMSNAASAAQGGRGSLNAVEPCSPCEEALKEAYLSGLRTGYERTFKESFDHRIVLPDLGISGRECASGEKNALAIALGWFIESFGNFINWDTREIERSIFGLGSVTSLEWDFALLSRLCQDELSWIYRTKVHPSGRSDLLDGLDRQVRSAIVGDLSRPTLRLRFGLEAIERVLDRLSRISVRVIEGPQERPGVSCESGSSLLVLASNVQASLWRETRSLWGERVRPAGDFIPSYAAQLTLDVSSDSIIVPWACVTSSALLDPVSKGRRLGGMGALIAHEYAHACFPSVELRDPRPEEVSSILASAIVGGPGLDWKSSTAIEDFADRAGVRWALGALTTPEDRASQQDVEDFVGGWEEMWDKSERWFNGKHSIGEKRAAVARTAVSANGTCV